VRVVDASVWVSLYATDDVNHSATLAWFEQVADAGEELVAPTFALVEVAAAMARRTRNPEDGRRAAARLLATPSRILVPVSDDLLGDAAELAVTLLLRAGDAPYVAVAARLGIGVVTWDREQLTRGAAVVQTATPADDLRDETADS
jgi:predicted nucleic acid-binding protein